MAKASKKNMAMEELFRVPIFESASQRSVMEDYSAEEENEGNVNGQESVNTKIKSDVGLPYDTQFDKDKVEYRQQMLNLLQGKQGLAWARKLFFLSTEMIFPGFVQSAEAQNHIGYYMGVRVRSSCLLQLLLYADVFFFAFWFISFLCTFDITTSVLKELHGYLFLCLAVLFSAINIARTRFGFWGNENDEVQYLALYWMTTSIVELPLLGFIVFTDVFSPCVLPYIVTMDSIMLMFIFLESVVGFHHFNSLLRDEIKIIRMARRTENLLKNREATSHLRPKVTNTVKGPHVQWVPKDRFSDGDEVESSSEESTAAQDSITLMPGQSSKRRKPDRVQQSAISNPISDQMHSRDEPEVMPTEQHRRSRRKSDPVIESSESSIVSEIINNDNAHSSRKNGKKKV